MDDSFLHRAASAAGYRLAPDQLTRAATAQPDHVANWIVAAARYTATSRIHRLLTDAAQHLRDRITGIPAAQFGSDVETLAAICDLLDDIDEDLDDALRDIGRHSAALARLNQPPLIDDPAATALPAALAGRQDAYDASGDGPTGRAHPIAGGNPLPPGRRRPRRPHR